MSGAGKRWFRRGVNKARCSWCQRMISHKRWFGWTHICEGVHVGERAINRGLN